MNIRFNRKKSLGPLALLTGAFFAWKNRFLIQEKLETVGIKTPWLNNGLDNTVRSGGAKAKGILNRTRIKSDLKSGVRSGSMGRVGSRSNSTLGSRSASI